MEWAVVVFVLFLILNMPIGFTIALSGLTFFIVNMDSLPLVVAINKIVTSTQNYTLLAVPFFVMAGQMMSVAGISTRMMKFANLLTGHMRGGLAQITIVLSCLMGGISGSSVADATMQSRLLGPSMDEKGYSQGYSSAAIAVSSMIPCTIPPATGLILFGFVTEVSIGDLFLAGIIPGILMTVLMMIPAYLIAKKRGYPVERDQMASLKEILKSFIENVWALIFPVFLITALRFGIFTPSEAGAFTVVYSIFIGVFVYKELTFKNLIAAIRGSVVDIGAVMLMITMASMIGHGIVFENISSSIADILLGISTNPYIVLGAILLFIFISGMFIETTINILMFAPIFLPIVASMGINPVFFGILFTIVANIGAVTPPVGVTVYAVCRIMKCKTEEYLKESIPFIASILVLVVVLIAFPTLVTILPDMLG